MIASPSEVMRVPGGPYVCKLLNIRGGFAGHLSARTSCRRKSVKLSPPKIIQILTAARVGASRSGLEATCCSDRSNALSTEVICSVLTHALIIVGMIREEITGTGQLVSRQDSLQQWKVFYYFEIDKRIPDGKVTQYHSRGVVRSENGTALPEGEYELRADGQRLRFANLGLGGWAILNS